MSLNILGVKIDQYGREEVLEKIISFLSSDQKRYIATPNPEILLEAQKDEEFFYILNKSDLSLPDGIGLKIASWFLGENLKVIKGADLLPEIVKISYDRKIKISFILWQNGLTKNAVLSNYLNNRYPNLNFQIIETDRDYDNFNIKELEQFQPDVMVVALGAPYQEKFIYHIQKKIVNLKLSIGIGGAIDFLTGEIKRAPKFLRNIGLEWLWRLFKQPWRWKRIYNAVIKFFLKFLKWRLILPFIYRKNVVCLLYKKSENRIKILVVERTDDKNHWQLPQGGTDGLPVEVAGRKELNEELNTNNFNSKAIFIDLYKYSFGKKLGKYKDQKKHSGYRGQNQSLYIAEYLGNDTEIKINFWDHANWQWVDSNELLELVYEHRKDSTKIFLNKLNKTLSI